MARRLRGLATADSTGRPRQVPQGMARSVDSHRDRVPDLQRRRADRKPRRELRPGRRDSARRRPRHRTLDHRHRGAHHRNRPLCRAPPRPARHASPGQPPRRRMGRQRVEPRELSSTAVIALDASRVMPAPAAIRERTGRFAPATRGSTAHQRSLRDVHECPDALLNATALASPVHARLRHALSLSPAGNRLAGRATGQPRPGCRRATDWLVVLRHGPVWRRAIARAGSLASNARHSGPSARRAHRAAPLCARLVVRA